MLSEEDSIDFYSKYNRYVNGYILNAWTTSHFLWTFISITKPPFPILSHVYLISPFTSRFSLSYDFLQYAMQNGASVKRTESVYWFVNYIGEGKRYKQLKNNYLPVYVPGFCPLVNRSVDRDCHPAFRLQIFGAYPIVEEPKWSKPVGQVPWIIVCKKNVIRKGLLLEFASGPCWAEKDPDS